MGENLDRLREKAARTRAPKPQSGVLERKVIFSEVNVNIPKNLPYFKTYHSEEGGKVIYLNKPGYITTAKNGEELKQVIRELKQRGIIVRVAPKDGNFSHIYGWKYSKDEVY